MLKRSSQLCAHVFASLIAFATSTYADTVNVRFPQQARSEDSNFTRMFPNLPPFAPQTDAVRQAAALLGARGGLLDALDNLSDPIQSIINQPVFSPNNRDNPTMTAGVTFFGQFLDHDVTLDRRSVLLANADPGGTLNFRTAAFDLDSLYGEGPEQSSELYDVSSGDYKFRIEAIPGSAAVSRGGVQRYDLPRDSVTGDAIIGDSRNDENVILAQFHLAMLRFHNAVVDQVRATPRWQGATARDVFEEARRSVTWHYQWIIVHEFLPMTIGQPLVDQLFREPENRGFYDPSVRHDKAGFPAMPIEFSVAAYRFGHSQVRPSYRLNFGPDGGPPFFAFIFDDAIDPNTADPGDLRGGKRAPRRFVDWQTFFDFGDGNVRSNKLIDTKLSTPLMNLPGSRGPAPGLPSDGQQSLASRNLIRHVNFGLPSGQAIAATIGVPALQLAELLPYGMAESTPLWYYILKEAELLQGGTRLGPVGGRIVGEVFVDLLRADRTSYLKVGRSWKPDLPSAGGPGVFKMTDLLRFAGVVTPLQ